MKKPIQIKNPKNAGLSLIELLLVLILIAGAIYAYMTNQRDKDRELARNRFSEEVVTVVKAMGQKIHVDGYLLKKPTNYVDDVTGRKGTALEPSFWDNAGATLLSTAKTSGSKTIYYFDTQVPTILNKLLVARANVTCGAADGWVPVPVKEAKTALIPCKLWQTKMPYNLIPKLYLKYQDTPITPNTESTTPSNTVVNSYVNDIFLTFQFSATSLPTNNYANIADMVSRMNIINRKSEATGTMSYYFATLNHTGGDANALGLDIAISPLECFRTPTTCLIVARWSASGTSGEENLRLDGMNSMIDTSINFKMGADQTTNKALCSRFVKTSDVNNDEAVPGDVDDDVPVDEAPKTHWIFQENVPCGIGISTTTSTSTHTIADDQVYSVNSLSGSSNFKAVTLDRKCNNFDLDTNNLIYNSTASTPCGIIHSPDGTTDQIIMYANEVQAKEGIFGQAANGSGVTNGTIHSRTVMIQENAIFNTLGVQGSFNALKGLQIIGSGKVPFQFSDANWQTELSAMLSYCSNVSSGVGTSTAVLAGCQTLNSGTLNVTGNTKIKGSLQLDGILTQGSQDITQSVTLTGDVKMGSTKNTDVYTNTAGDEVATLCVGHDLLQGDESCTPNQTLNPNGGDLNVGSTPVVSATVPPTNPNWLAVGGASGAPSTGPDRYKPDLVTFNVDGGYSGLPAATNYGSRVSITKNWDGKTFQAPIGNNAVNGVYETSILKVENGDNSTGSYVQPEAFNMKLNTEITRTETFAGTTTANKTYSYWAKTFLPTALNVLKSTDCTKFQIGTITRSSKNGEMLTCVSTGGTPDKQWVATIANLETKQSSNSTLGKWDFCTLTTLGALKNSGKCELNFTADATNPNIRSWTLINRGRCQATCIGKVADVTTPDTWNFVYTTCGYYNTADRLPSASDDPNATDAQLGFIGGSGYSSPIGNPPVGASQYGYPTGAKYNCVYNDPPANTVRAGTIFTQNGTCQQPLQQSCYIYEQNQNGDTRIRNIGSGSFPTNLTDAQNPAFGNSNAFIGTVAADPQQAVGTMPFLPGT